jgi:dsDNA-specific endonuclease/ATPase MutS2
MMSFSLETLEFEKLLQLVARNAQTPMGWAAFLRSAPENKSEPSLKTT